MTSSDRRRGNERRGQRESAIAKRSRRARGYLGAALLLLGIVASCSSHSDTVLTPPGGPPSIAITAISLGRGESGQGGDASVLDCDYTIGVKLDVGFWTLRTPGLCDATLQCGPVRLSLLDGTNGHELGKAQYAANTSVDLNLTKLLNVSLLRAGSYAIKAELVNDAGTLFPVTNGGNSAVQRAFTLSLPRDCEERAGTAGAPSSEGGAAGFGGVPDFGAEGGAIEAGSGGTSGA